MRSRRNSRQPAPDGVAVVTGPNLKEAYRRVRLEFGRNAVILGTRTVSRRHELGLGHDRVVEVSVQTDGPDGGGTYRPAPARAGLAAPPGSGAGPRTVAEEVARIEALVDSLAGRCERLAGPDPADLDHPVAEALIAAGTRETTVRRVLQRFTGETGGDPRDRAGFLDWLRQQLRAGNCGWSGFYGCHAFVGHSGTGRQDLVLATASRFQDLGRKTLVLVLFPQHAGQIRRLQTEAAQSGYDAAILRQETQLERLAQHLARYEVVLVDLPDLDAAVMREGSDLHRWLSANPGFHRHLVVGLDCDLEELDPLAGASRHWNCDWVAVTRTHRTRRQGKLLDVLESLPLPVSLVTGEGEGRQGPAIAGSGDLLDAILAAGAGEVPGLVRLEAGAVTGRNPELP